jgi:hypothetical protein
MKSDDAPKLVMPTSLPFQVFDFLYFRPSVAKEAKYFEGEGLSVELVRVGGSTESSRLGGRQCSTHSCRRTRSDPSRRPRRKQNR